MCHHGCTGAIDRSLFVLATTESGIEAALRRVAARSQCGAVTLLVPHLPTGASDVDRVKRWQTLAERPSRGGDKLLTSHSPLSISVHERSSQTSARALGS